MSERQYQRELIRRLETLFPGCLILKNDSELKPGIPDLTIFYGDRWAMLEVKADANAPERPNQRWYVDQMRLMSYAAFIYPENEEDILYELQYALHAQGQTRVSEPELLSLDQLRRTETQREMVIVAGRKTRNRSSRSCS